MRPSELISELQKSKNELLGAIEYEIMGDGCLNGLWSNNKETVNGRFMNEIARKKSNNAIEIDGEYTVAYIQNNHESFTGSLKINRHHDGTYNLFWTHIRNSNSEFQGFGFHIGGNKIIVLYWQTK